MEIMYQFTEVRIRLLMTTIQPTTPLIMKVFPNFIQWLKLCMFLGGGCCLFVGTPLTLYKTNCKTRIYLSWKDNSLTYIWSKGRIVKCYYYPALSNRSPCSACKHILALCYEKWHEFYDILPRVSALGANDLFRYDALFCLSLPLIPNPHLVLPAATV